ncbi:MAG: MBL fold metallo-hydrolase [Rhizobiaceae bacterium]
MRGILIAFIVAVSFHGSAAAATSTCLAVADSGDMVHRAAYREAARDGGDVSITYVGHSAFRISSPGGTTIVTDYNGYSGDGPLPDAVTMNHAHATHYTDFPDPAITHVLRGWNSDGDEPARHQLELGDMLIRNVTTDLYLEGALLEKDGNSIFIFETAGLCIGHLGHLHHRLTPQHIAAIGRIDILFVPVDGTYTMSLDGMIELAGQLRSSIVIPMHWFSTYTLQRFLSGMQERFSINLMPERTTTVSLETLPDRPEVRVLPAY